MRMFSRLFPAFFVILVGLLFVGFTPPPKPTHPHAVDPFRVSVRVIDLLTRQPIPNAKVSLSHSSLISLTDAQGQISFLRSTFPTDQVFSIRAEHPRYMGTIQTQVLLQQSSHEWTLAMPDLQRLEEADRFIRDARVLDPNRQQIMTVETVHVHPPAIGGGDPPPPNPPPTGGVTYKLPNTIRVDKGGGNIITLNLEEYLKGVLPREIGSSFPFESMKAQAVAARTYTVNFTGGGRKAICTTTRCQVWGTTRYAQTDKAVDATRGIVALHSGKISGGYFAASCGGSTINSEQLWNYRAYLRARPCIENKKGLCSVVCKPSTCNNRRCPNSHSTCWGIFGHRIGLCQRGSQAMGKCGKKFDEIVKHYYTGIQLANMNVTRTFNNAKLTGEDLSDGSKVKPSQAFRKRWTLQNIGTNTWNNATYTLHHVSGPTFGSSKKIQLTRNVPPQQQINISANFTAPATPGTYKSIWQMNENKTAFGPKIWVQIVVEKPPPPKPQCNDKDGDGYTAPGPNCPPPHDCNDNDKTIYPGAPDICGNGKDEDCLGGDRVCNNTPNCVDNDKDNYGVGAGCQGAQDCDDNDKTVHPGAVDICDNGKDEDCSGSDRVCNQKDCNDNDQDGHGVGADCQGPQDCNDNDKTVHPGAQEICGNGKDDDCQGGDQSCNNNPNKLLKFGESDCKGNNDCETNLCVLYRGKQICSRACSKDKNDCPDNYACTSDTACWPTAGSNFCNKDSDCPNQSFCNNGTCQVKDKEGCGCESNSPPSFSWIALLGLLGLLSLLRIRRQPTPPQ